MKKIILGLCLFYSLNLYASCQNPAPRAQPISIPSDVKDCPSGYSYITGLCTPGSSASYAYVKPAGGNCPSGYGGSSRWCTANSGACYAFPSNGNCPSGYSGTSSYCVSN